ncbi:MAG TPA: hypothetical protein P5163_01295 [Rubrivivax sp.]|nr:hypothetical protein [Rubrivivax sp.]
MALTLVIIKAILEVAALALMGQFLVGIFAWGRRGENVIYKLFQVIASPFTRLVRLVTPKFVVDQHIPLATFLLLAFAWLFVLFELRASCIANPAQRSCPQVEQAAPAAVAPR